MVVARGSSLQPGDVVAGRYRLLQPAGAGALSHAGLGPVLDAVDLASGAAVRVTLSTGRSRVPIDAAGIAEVLATTRAVVGSHVAAVADAGVHVGPDGAATPFLVSAEPAGPRLHDLLAAGPLPHRAVLSLGAAVADGLVAAHAEGVVHRAVRPAAVLVPNGMASNAVLTDLGVADLLGRPGALRYRRLFGSDAYLSPEQREHAVVGPATDVYALALVLMEAFGGRPLAGRPPSDVPAQVRATLIAATSVDPGSRPGAGELAAALRAESARARAHRAAGAHVAPAAGSPPVPAVRDPTPTTASVPIPFVVPAPVAATEAVTGAFGDLVTPGGRRVAFAISGAFAALVLIGAAAFLPATGADEKAAGRTAAAAADGAHASAAHADAVGASQGASNSAQGAPGSAASGRGAAAGGAVSASATNAGSAAARTPAHLAAPHSSRSSSSAPHATASGSTAPSASASSSPSSAPSSSESSTDPAPSSGDTAASAPSSDTAEDPDAAAETTAASDVASASASDSASTDSAAASTSATDADSPTDSASSTAQ